MKRQKPSAIVHMFVVQGVQGWQEIDEIKA